MTEKLFTGAQIVDAFYGVLMPQTARELEEGGAPRVWLSDLMDMVNQLLAKTPDSPDGLAGERVEDPTTLRKGDRVHITLRGDTQITGEIQEVMDFYDTQQNEEATRIIFKDAITVGLWEIVEATRYKEPVAHPDPEENHLIVIRKALGRTAESPVLAVWDGAQYYDIISPDYVGSYAPHAITDWSHLDPAKVVEDDR